MGTPRVSGSSDQMRRMQVTARVGGECALDSMLNKKFASTMSAMNGATKAVGRIVPRVCWSEVVFDNGWELGPVRWCDVAQHVLFAQQPISHAFSLGVFVTKHGVAGNRTAAPKSASPTATETVILLIIGLPSSTNKAADRIRSVVRYGQEPQLRSCCSISTTHILHKWLCCHTSSRPPKISDRCIFVGNTRSAGIEWCQVWRVRVLEFVLEW